MLLLLPPPPPQAEFNKVAQAGAGVRTLRKEPLERVGLGVLLAGRSRTMKKRAMNAREMSGQKKHSLP